ncbi:MAG TPA: type III-A CRISPR-associated protein Csm2 [Anaerolineales bacterium]|nr:type III-A CRISPR-associated protein Csm2 [Anaerolineales bacterium]
MSQHRNRPSETRSGLSSQERSQLEAIIARGDAAQLVDWADALGKTLVQKNLTTSQIRNIFGAVRQVRMTWDQNPEGAYRQAVLLMPKLGYYAKRERGRGKQGLVELERVLVPALELVAKAPEKERKQRFKHFVDFFEAILAYHKKYGGRDK